MVIREDERATQKKKKKKSAGSFAPFKLKGESVDQGLCNPLWGESNQMIGTDIVEGGGEQEAIICPEGPENSGRIVKA